MIQMVFQDCFSSMDPRQRVGDALVEVLKIHQVCPPAERLPIVVNMIEQVGLRPEHLFRYPHEFSGGQRQRIGLARALLLHPELVTRIAGLQTGQYDLIYGLTSDNYDIIANTPGVETQTQEAGTLVLVMNKKEGLCTDVNFRQAVNAALSMDDIMTVGYGSFYSLGSCYMDECNGFWLTDAGSENYNRSDLELAKKYLAQSSYQEGDVFTIMTTNENNRDKLALVIASQLEAIGITCDVQPYDYPTMNAYQSDPSLYDMFVISYSSVPLPTLKFYLGSGAGFWTTDETFQNYISCFNQATTKDEAYQIWEELQAYCWNDYLPVINCGHYQECYAWNADTLSNVNIYNNIAHMWSVSVN